MKVFSWLFFLGGFIVGLFWVLIPTIFTWSALFDSTVGGILFSLGLFPVAILGYPIVILIAGLATGIGGTASVLATLWGYGMMVAVFVLWFIGSWISDKAEQRQYSKNYESNRLADSQINIPALASTYMEDSERYVGNLRSKVVHDESCDSLNYVDPDLCIYFDTIEEALDKGYRTCKRCLGS